MLHNPALDITESRYYIIINVLQITCKINHLKNLHVIFVDGRKLYSLLPAQPRGYPLPDRHLHADVVVDVDAGQVELLLLFRLLVIVDVVHVVAGIDLVQ